MEFSCFFYDPMNVGNMIAGSSAFSKSSLNIWKLSVHVPLKPILENFEHYFLACEMSATVYRLNILWHWLSLGLEWKLILKLLKMLKLKLQYFDKVMWKSDSLEKILMLGKIEGKRRRGKQKMGWLDNIIDSVIMNLSKLWDIMENRGICHTIVFEVLKSQTWLETEEQTSEPLHSQNQKFLRQSGMTILWPIIVIWSHYIGHVAT